VASKLTKLFDTIRHQHLKEDFEIGQAAQALFELQKTAKQFNEFLNGPFKVAFKKMTNDPRNIEELSRTLSDQLDMHVKEMSSVVDEMKSYLSDQDMYVNPESMHKDSQRSNRWSRWEHRTPRHIRKQQDKDDGF